MNGDFSNLNKIFGINDIHGNFKSPYPIQNCVERINLYAKQRYVVGGTNKSPVIYTSFVKEIQSDGTGNYYVTIGTYYQFKGFNLATLKLQLSEFDGLTEVKYTCGVKDSFKINV